MKRRSLLSLLALILCFSTLLSVSVSAAGGYGITVAGVEVTASNAADVLGDGKVSYDAAKDILYLDGATIDYSGNGIVSSSDLTIEFDGRNVIYADSTGIVCGGDLELFGYDKTASLYIDAEFYGIDADNDIYVEYANVDVYTSGRRNAGAVYSSGGAIELEDCKVSYPSSARITTDKTTGETYIAKSGDICVDVEIVISGSSSSSSSNGGWWDDGWGNNWGSGWDDDDWYDDCDCTYWDNCDCSYWCDCDCYYCDCDDWYYDDCTCSSSYGDCRYNCDCDGWCDCYYCDCDDYWYECDCDPWESCYYCDKYYDEYWNPSRWYDSINTHPYFTDVSKYDTFYEDVIYVYNKGLMNGVGDNKFDPYGTATRGMIVTVLHRMENEPNVNAGLTFSDVPADAYYTKAVKWAVANGIITGYDNGTFGPNDTITREQLISILYRYAKSEGYRVSSSSSLTSFEDAGKISEYALPAYKWANAKDYLTGYSLQPQAAAPRWMIANLLHNFMLDY